MRQASYLILMALVLAWAALWPALQVDADRLITSSNRASVSGEGVQFASVGASLHPAGTMGYGDEVGWAFRSRPSAEEAVREIRESREHAGEDYNGRDGRRAILQSRPNPENPVAQIAYTLPGATHASVRVVDVLGREVALLTDDHREEGTYLLTFDGSRLRSGMYICVLETEFETVTEMMVLRK